jgi:hypothetical protein
MACLPWISDEDLTAVVAALLAKAEEAVQKAETKFGRNVIDPFSAIFQIAGFGINHEKWRIAEQTRQAEKSLQNHIGDFHQSILCKVPGWEIPPDIMDLVCHERRIIAEVKNKHNTLTGTNLINLYNVMNNAVSPKHSKFNNYTAYYVTVIPKRPVRFDKTFFPSDRQTGTRTQENELIRHMDGAGFYHLATGHQDALKDLFTVLPKIIADISGTGISTTDFKILMDYFQSAYGN